MESLLSISSSSSAICARRCVYRSESSVRSCRLTSRIGIRSCCLPNFMVLPPFYISLRKNGEKVSRLQKCNLGCCGTGVAHSVECLVL